MTFLKKLGQILLTATSVAAGITPMLPTNIQSGVTKSIDVIRKMMAMIVAVEVVGQQLNLPGSQKLTAAAPLIAQLILESDIMIDDLSGKKRKIDNPVLFHQGATKIADGLADVLNSFKDEFETESFKA